MSSFTEFLRAFAESGNPTADPTLLPLMGPNGAQIWTAGIGIDRRQPPHVESFTVTTRPDQLVAPSRRWHLWPRAWRFSPVS
jgi:hypothetical protein